MLTNLFGMLGRKHQPFLLAFVVTVLLLGGCAAVPPQVSPAEPVAEITPVGEETQISEPTVADVISVQVTGSAQSYQFAVEVRSPDEGCDQYANWWEVLTEDGTVLYRRILTHSHVGEQPFVRSGGPVAIEPETVVLVRAYMHPDGYGGMAMKGTAIGGFEQSELAAGFANGVANDPPQPTGCDG